MNFRIHKSHKNHSIFSESEAVRIIQNGAHSVPVCLPLYAARQDHHDSPRNRFGWHHRRPAPSRLSNWLNPVVQCIVFDDLEPGPGFHCTCGSPILSTGSQPSYR